MLQIARPPPRMQQAPIGPVPGSHGSGSHTEPTPWNAPPPLAHNASVVMTQLIPKGSSKQQAPTSCGSPPPHLRSAHGVSRWKVPPASAHVASVVSKQNRTSSKQHAPVRGSSHGNGSQVVPGPSQVPLQSRLVDSKHVPGEQQAPMGPGSPSQGNRSHVVPMP